MSWQEMIQRWRALSVEKRKRLHLQAIPKHTARSMAMEGEPVDESYIRERLARHIGPADASTRASELVRSDQPKTE